MENSKEILIGKTAELKILLEQREVFRAKSLLSELQAADIADIISEWKAPEEMAVIFRLIQPDMITDTFSHLTAEEQQNIIEHLTDKKVAELIESLPDDDRTSFFLDQPVHISKRLFGLLTPETKQTLFQMMNYPEDSAGRLITKDYIELSEDMKVSEAMELIRSEGMDSETIYTLYVLSGDKKLVGVLSLRDLVLANPDDELSKFMETDLIFANAHDDKEEVARRIEKYDLLAMPIVDQNHRLAGIVTVDDVVDILVEEATEDAHKMAAMEHVENEYFDTSNLEFFKKRVGWLIILFLEGLFTVTILKHYDATLSQMVALVAFLPLIISSGGNAGAQSATLITRAIALREIHWDDFFKVVTREASIGVFLGILLGALGAFRAVIGGELAQVSLIVGSTLFLVVLFATLTGSGIPMILHRAGFDPAVSSSPFIASLVDVFGLIIYCNIALAVMKYGI